MKLKIAWVVILVFALGSTEIENGIKIRTKRATTKYLDLTETQKKLIVNKHNELRRIVSPSAADMLYMSWDNDLEKVATDYSKKCIYEHNDARKVERFKYIGENLYLSYGHKVNDNYGANAVVSWDSEKADFSYGSLSCSEVCGHYTQVAWAQSYKVGCGMTTCQSIEVSPGNIWYDATLFVCNYGPGGNIQGVKPYVSGPTCSKCPAGDTCKDNLCTNSTRDATSGGTRTYERPVSWTYVFTFSLAYLVRRLDRFL